MRDAFHEELDHTSDQLVEMTRLAGSAMARATTALLDADLALAESVIAADDALDRIQRELDDLALDLLARQQPVATDLRIIVTGMRMSADLERMGDLARHVAKVARRRYPESAVPPVLRSTILEMGQVAERIVAKAGSVIASKDVASAVQLEQGWRPPSTSP
jgi:phosphate transport system protein